MKVYKYRGGGSKVFERDLHALEHNFFWAPSFEDLNDPCETLVYEDQIKMQIAAIKTVFGASQEATDSMVKAIDNLMARKAKIGIYSLSMKATHELLWAHYADSHRGFCAEFATDVLVGNNMYQELHQFHVEYKDSPPSLEISDVSNNKGVQTFKKLAGTKSKLWSYEEEYRLLTDVIGENYYDYTALTGIYFGNKMDPAQQSEVMKALQGRGIKYYKINLKVRSYKFTASPLSDAHAKAKNYLFTFPTLDKNVQYKIQDKTYRRFYHKGMATVILREKIEKEDLLRLSQEIKMKVFRGAKVFFLSFVISELIKGTGYWATSQLKDGTWEAKIGGLSIQQERDLIAILMQDKREVVGIWINQIPYSMPGWTILNEKEGLVLERRHIDGSIITESLKLDKHHSPKKFISAQSATGKDYYILNESGDLYAYEDNELFAVLKPVI